MKRMEELTITVPWGHIAAKAWGSATNFPVLCVHGLLDNAGAFDRLIALLPEKFYYVVLDLPGHGLSSHMPHGLTLNYYDYILSLRLVVEKFKWKHFHYIGHSLGAQFGIFYSVIYPNQIQKIVLIEGFAMITPTENVISKIRHIQDSTVRLEKEKERLYTRDEVMYSLKYRRGVCLNSGAAEALFKRSVSEVNGMFKYNRDIRLKLNILTTLNLQQVASIFSNIQVEKLLFFITMGSIDSNEGNSFLMLKQNLENFDIAKVEIIMGNHDVHNNHPERLATDISNLFNETKISSKL